MSVVGEQHAARQDAGRIHHIVLAYRDAARQLAARQRFTEILGIDDWVDLGVIEAGHVAVVVSWSSGLELLAPTGPGSILDDHLAAHGEGFYSLVFGVDDLEASVDRAKAAGTSVYRLPRPPERAFERFTVAREAVLGEIGAIDVILGEFVTQPG